MLQLKDFEAVCADNLMCALALQVYNDLLQAEPLITIDPQFDAEFPILYLSTVNSTGQHTVYLPTLHSKDLDFVLVQNLQTKLADSNIILAIVDNTANILYYQIKEGLSEKS